MTRIYHILLTSLVMAMMAAAQQASAQSAMTIEADSAYMNDDFVKALECYQTVAQQEGTSSDLYYNIGNCYYRLGRPGMAIVNYERALRLNPRNAEARQNLEFVNSRITDKPGDRGMFITKTANAIARQLGANTWATLALLAFVLCLGCICLYIFPASIPLRKTGFFGAFVMLGLCILANVAASLATHYSTASHEAVVTVPSSMLSTSPRTPKDRQEEALLLHEGTKVDILDSVTTRIDSTATKWLDIRVDNEHRAWIRDTDVTRI